MTRKAVELNDLKVVKKYVDDEIKEKVADALKEVVKQGNRLYSVGGFEVVDEQGQYPLFEIDNDGVMYLIDPKTGNKIAPNKEEFLGSMANQGAPRWLKITDLSAFKDLLNRTNNAEKELAPAIEIKFPKVNEVRSSGTNVGNQYLFECQQEQKYIHSSGYKRCKIKYGTGNTYVLDATLRKLFTTDNGIYGQASRMAKYENGVLTVVTKVSAYRDTNTSALLNADECSATAQFYQTACDSTTADITFPSNLQKFPTPTQTSAGYYTCHVQTSVTVPVATDEYDCCVINGTVVNNPDSSGWNPVEIKRTTIKHTANPTTYPSGATETTTYLADFSPGHSLMLTTWVELVMDEAPQFSPTASGQAYKTSATFSQANHDLLVEAVEFPAYDKSPITPSNLIDNGDGTWLVVGSTKLDPGLVTYSHPGYTKCVINGLTVTSDAVVIDTKGTFNTGFTQYSATFANGTLSLFVDFKRIFTEKPTSNVEFATIYGPSPVYATFSK